VIEMIIKIPENYLIPSEWPVMVFVGIFGLVVFVAGYVMGLQRYALHRHGVTTQGHVVEMETRKHRSKDEEGRPTTTESYHPVIVFAAASGAKHRFTGDGGAGPLAHDIGSTVNVLYDPKDPSTARIEEIAKWKFWAEPLFIGLVGFLVVAGSIGTFFYNQHRLIGEHAEYAEIRRESENKTRLHWEEQITRLKARVQAGEILLYKGVVESVRKQQGGSGEEYVVVCWATLPDGTTQGRFEAEPISVHPGPEILGKSVEIYVDAADKTRYGVMLEPLLAELQSSKR